MSDEEDMQPSRNWRRELVGLGILLSIPVVIGLFFALRPSQNDRAEQIGDLVVEEPGYPDRSGGSTSGVATPGIERWIEVGGGAEYPTVEISVADTVGDATIIANEAAQRAFVVQCGDVILGVWVKDPASQPGAEARLQADAASVERIAVANLGPC